MRLILANKVVAVGKCILYEYGNVLGPPPYPTKERIGLLFMSRCVRQLDAVSNLAAATFVSDGWILYRSLLERYLLYRHLCGNGDFQVYDDWCFKKLYEMNNRIKASSDLQKKEEVKSRRFSSQEKTRYHRVRTDPAVANWRRPDIEKVARKLNLKFLYDAGYDHASGFVHPLSTDGESDFLRLTNRAGEAVDDGADVLVHNSILIALLHMQEFMNQPEHNWIKLLYDTLDQFARMLEDPKQICDGEFARLVELGRQGKPFVMKLARNVSAAS